METSPPEGPAQLQARYEEATRFINEGLIREGQDHPASEKNRREWMASFLPRLGHPEQAFPAIHIAGTSGKGSTATMVAEILRAAGYRCGLHVSPYVQVATEKLWVDGRYATVERYCELVEWMRPHALAARGAAVPMHGMASVGLCLEFFRREAVEVGVVEVGVGGRYDLTTVLATEVAAVTNVGMDHLKTLGPTLEDIAWHKAGVIVPGSRGVVFAGSPQAAQLVACQRQAARANAALRVVSPQHYTYREEPDGTPCPDLRSERFHMRQVGLGGRGVFQAQNAALALAVCEEFDRKQGRLNEGAIREGLGRARQPARVELMAPRAGFPCPTIIDGAHNPDKLAGLAASLGAYRSRPMTLICGSLAAKGVSEALVGLAAKAARVVCTQPQVYGKEALPAAQLATALGVPHHKLDLADDAREALALARDMTPSEGLLLATGSLYLAGELRDAFFPRAQILRRQTSWF